VRNEQVHDVDLPPARAPLPLVAIAALEDAPFQLPAATLRNTSRISVALDLIPGLAPGLALHHACPIAAQRPQDHYGTRDERRMHVVLPPVPVLRRGPDRARMTINQRMAKMQGRRVTKVAERGIEIGIERRGTGVVALTVGAKKKRKRKIGRGGAPLLERKSR